MFFPASAIITTYGSLLLIIAFFFLMRDNSVHKLQHALPLSFIFRFCTFWFISLVLAVVFFMVNLNINHYTSSESDKIKARRVGLLALGITLLGTVLAVAVVYLFQL